jgi:predicted HAD superfamily Cof-like phosphohydrolase
MAPNTYTASTTTMYTFTNAESTTATTTDHYDRVKEFCFLAGQSAPDTLTAPTPETAMLRARLILEEALETVEALGITPYFLPGMASTSKIDIGTNVGFAVTHEPNLVEIADGCADISVVTTGTLIACGIPDEPLLAMVDQNNLEKFGPGSSVNEHGKFVKPPGHKPPDIQNWLASLTAKDTNAD